MINLRAVSSRSRNHSSGTWAQSNSGSVEFAAQPSSQFLGNIGESLGWDEEDDNQAEEENANIPNDLNSVHNTLAANRDSEIFSVALSVPEGTQVDLTH